MEDHFPPLLILFFKLLNLISRCITVCMGSHLRAIEVFRSLSLFKIIFLLKKSHYMYL